MVLLQKTELFSPVSIKVLFQWILKELDFNNSIFGIPKEFFFVPSSKDRFKMEKFGMQLDTPIGVAAGPHTQMAQNIIVAWLCGSRFIELKTVQTLDELDVAKPCIDAFDEGYNCEWSQELLLKESFDEYLMAWIIIHALKDKFGWEGDLGMIFNMSVGYNMEGILKDNVQQFLTKMKNSSKYKNKMIEEIASFYPRIKEIEIPDRLSNSITLSTMHGCPPDEIERIGRYLIENGYHTFIKFNPTLLGADLLRKILNEDLEFDVDVPDVAFEHDPTFDAVKNIINNLNSLAKEKAVNFGAKTTNTLESMNLRKVLPEKEEMNYMSGRALHPITVNVAKKINEQFNGEISISLAGGANAYNMAEIISCNIKPVTVCTDILKPGGYLLTLQYLENLAQEMEEINAIDINDFICKVALSNAENVKDLLPGNIDSSNFLKDLDNKSVKEILIANMKDKQEMVIENTFKTLIRKCGSFNLKNYADDVRKSNEYHKESLEGISLKVDLELNQFDCINAPCVHTCPTDQNIPDYMYWTSIGDYKKAMEATLKDNALPHTLGRVCDHPCTDTCVRMHYDQPLAIREIKRFITENYKDLKLTKKPNNDIKVGIIGAGPAGLSAAFYLALDGFSVTIFEEKDLAGGQSRLTIPSFRLPNEVCQEDIDRIVSLGVEIIFNKTVTVSELRSKGFKYVFVSVGAKKNRQMGIDGENAEGVYDSLSFLYNVKINKSMNFGEKIAIVGGGNSAIDAARTAWRLQRKAHVTVLYRRTKKEMPVEREEITALLAEGIQIKELVNPIKIITKNNKITGVQCIRMKLGEKDQSGRPRPVPIEGSEFILDIDNLIIAIGQVTDLEFLKNDDIKTKWGLIETDPITRRTSKERVYAGGDVVRGPSSLVKAVGDGRGAAKSIIWEEYREKSKLTHNIKTNQIDLLKRKSKKKIISNAFLHDYSNVKRDFTEVDHSINENNAKGEAGRCFLCNDMCSICVTVCPNLANITYQITPFQREMNKLEVQDKSLIQIKDTPYRVSQPFQILNIVDFCNECGNCTTFCPTSGAPYKDKPKIFLKEDDFNDYEIEYNAKCYFIKVNNEEIIIKGKINNEEQHELKMNKDTEVLEYKNSRIKLQLDGKTFDIKEKKLLMDCEKGTEFSLIQCADMYTIIKGICESMQFLPQFQGE